MLSLTIQTKRKEKRKGKENNERNRPPDQTRKKITSRGKYEGHGLRIYSMLSASCNLMHINEGQCMACIAFPQLLLPCV